MLRPASMMTLARAAGLLALGLVATTVPSLAASGVDAQQTPAAKQPPATTLTETGTETDDAFVTRPGSVDEICRAARFTVGAATLCVSSVLEPQSGNRYGGGNLIDDKDSTAWVEGADGDGIGEYISVEFEQPVSISAILLSNGYAKNRDIFVKNNRVRDISIATSDGREQEIALSDESGWQTLSVSLEGPTKWLMLKVGSVYRGSKYRDTAITGLDIR